MLIKFSKDLSKESLFAVDREQTSIMGREQIGSPILVHEFNDPVLVTDNYKIGLLPSTIRDTIFSLFASPIRTTEYDGVATIWDTSVYNSVWSPSIDTLIIARAINRLLPEITNFKTGLEIGCGSGFLSQYTLEKSNISQMTINDINPLSIKCAQDNINDNRAFFHLGDGLKLLSDKKYDFIVCNPPYIPRPGINNTNPYEGVGILNYLVHNGKKHLNPGGFMLVGLSNLSEPIIFKDKIEPGIETVEELSVPMKINNIHNTPDWMEYLKSKGLDQNEHSGYQFWHTIKTFLIRN